ncbi:glycosyltransferase [Pedobacter antarcticus]|uniref:glycosyltransferase n=1 Tax=Pedobacter antarcticus TaxID=34086 RepID=UPI0008823C29|nr:glycosyltransferase [Pedobacter antarcticus]SDM28058.1 Glycosyltransferase, catalytic subunit of cellulose synthase and poly-beta-1,6-N-acetylglucosamine synthase [Pedobacter antarcticus]
MEILKTVWIIFHFFMAFYFILPVLLLLIKLVRRADKPSNPIIREFDYAVIITAYQQTNLLPALVDSALKLNYSNYLIYIVADNCDISNLNFNSDKVVLLRPEHTLASNTKSHFHAIHNFKRPHEILTIIDSDNLVSPEYLNELNHFFADGYVAVQGVRQAKNLNTSYACLDEAGDIYYRFIDRKLLFECGSSASLAGSGMAFTTQLYRDCLETIEIEGAGFDKVLQMQILKRGYRIAFAEKAIVFDEKTAKSNQLVNQRARWINTWFKYSGEGVKLIGRGLVNLNRNQFFCGLVFSRPPLFMLALVTVIGVFVDVVLLPEMLYFWGIAIICFLAVFFAALSYFKAPGIIYKALVNIPKFIFLQILSLLKAKRANEISVATVHYSDQHIDEVENSIK